MLWSTILFILLFASVNSAVNNGMNYINKIIIEKNGQNYINIYAFPKTKILMETDDEKDFKFKIKNAGPMTPVKFDFTTNSPSTFISCQINQLTMDCKSSSLSTLFYLSVLPKNQLINLYDNYQAKGLSFSKHGEKYSLEISSEYTPNSNSDLCPFLMEWPSTVTLHVPHQIVPEKRVPVPSNYEIFEDKCESKAVGRCETLNHESGVTFSSKGIAEFTMALIDKEKTFKFFHASGIFSPIYTINSTISCTDYTTNITFNDLGFILFKRTGEKLDIQMEFTPNAQNVAGDKNPISKDSNIQFYFYQNYVNVFFFNLDGDFLMRTLILPDRMFANFEDSTKIQFDHQTSDTSCSDVVKLFVGNGVKILLPKYVKPTTPKAPTNPPTVPPPIISTTKIKEKASTASFPMEAIIAISCFFGIIFLGAFIFAIYYCIKKHKKRKNPKTPPTMMLDPSISMLEHEMASKKSKNNNILIDVPDSSKKLKDDIQILAGEPTNSVTPKKSSDEKEKEKVVPKYRDNKNDNEKKKATIEDGPSKSIKSNRFDPTFIKTILPASALASAKFYEDNPIQDEKIDWDKCVTNITITDDFWSLFSFFKADSRADLEGPNQGRREFQYQFIVRDLSLPENKMFYKFGARLNEPVDEEIVEVVAETADQNPPENVEAIAVRVFILNHDPPTIECIVNGRLPFFFFGLTKCKHCNDANFKPRFFNSSSRLSECLRELPLGHHILAQYGNGKNFKDSKHWKTVFAVKGGRQIIPLNLLYGAFMHPNVTQFQALKNTTTEDAKAATITQNKKEITKQKTKTKTKTIDGGDATAPTQPSVTIENPGA